MIFYLLITGLIGGVLAGLLGIGGGVIFISVLPYFFLDKEISSEDLPAYIVANSLIGTLFSSLFSAISQWRQNNNLDYKSGIILGISASVTAVLSLLFIVSQPWYTKTVFAYIVISILLVLLARTLFSIVSENDNVPQTSSVNKTKTRYISMLGAFSGLISSLSGLGGGVLLVPVLRFQFKFNVQTAAFMSSTAIAISSLSSVIYSLTANPEGGQSTNPFGYLLPDISMPLIAGVLIGAPVGVRISRKLDKKVISIIYSILIAAVILKFFYEASQN